MRREYYSYTIPNFISSTSEEIFGSIAQSSDFSVETTQRDAWLEQIRILKNVLQPYKGSIYFEYSIPRMAIDQTWDYALDLKNFHETSHEHYIAPILIETKAKTASAVVATTLHNDKLLYPIKSNEELLGQVIADVLLFAEGESSTSIQWEKGRY